MSTSWPNKCLESYPIRLIEKYKRISIIIEYWWTTSFWYSGASVYANLFPWFRIVWRITHKKRLALTLKIGPSMEILMKHRDLYSKQIVSMKNSFEKKNQKRKYLLKIFLCSNCTFLNNTKICLYKISSIYFSNILQSIFIWIYLI